MFEIVLLLVIVGAGTAGDLCVARSMRTLGEVTDFRPHAIVRVFGRAARVGWTWAGIALMAVAFFALLAMLSIENVSFVVPVTALSYFAGAVGGALFLGERVGVQRSFGIALVCIGVTLVWIGRA
jgi:drug/metabolite transporter (DMT)-like permease